MQVHAPSVCTRAHPGVTLPRSSQERKWLVVAVTWDCLVSGTALGSHSFSSAISGPRYSRIAPFTTCTLLTLGGHCVTKGGEVTPGGSNTDYRWAPAPHVQLNKREILFPCHLVGSRSGGFVLLCFKLCFSVSEGKYIGKSRLVMCSRDPRLHGAAAVT